MVVFNSIGSNYTWQFAWQTFFARAENNKEMLSAYLEREYGGRAYLTYKGREALTLALLAAKLPPQSKVIVSGYTCAAVVIAVSHAGLVPVYVDITAPNVNFSAQELANVLVVHPDAKAVIIQNTLGYPADIEPIQKICAEKNLVLIEDIAHSVGGTYVNGKVMGTVGDCVVFSFSQDKILDAVSGGALVIRNTKFTLEPPVFTSVSFKQQLRDRLYPLVTLLVRQTYSFGLGKILHRFFALIGLFPKPVATLEKSPVQGLPGWYAGLVLLRFNELQAQLKHRRTIAGVYEKYFGSNPLTPFSTCLRFPLVIDNRGALVAYLHSQNIYLSDIWYDVPVSPKRFWAAFDQGHTALGARQLATKSMNLPTHIGITPEIAEYISKYVTTWQSSQKK